MAKADIYRIKVTLKHSRPPIWRLIEVSSSTRLDTLHDILQITMGWTDSHLHVFRKGRTVYDDTGEPGDTRDERGVRLDEVAGSGDTLVYEYDFGDGWAHTLKIEKVVPPEPGARYPRCLAGKRACPPEDCGGIGVYTQMLGMRQNAGGRADDEMLEWLGEDFDPAAFDMAAVNAQLARRR